MFLIVPYSVHVFLTNQLLSSHNFHGNDKIIVYTCLQRAVVLSSLFKTFVVSVSLSLYPHLQFCKVERLLPLVVCGGGYSFVDSILTFDVLDLAQHFLVKNNITAIRRIRKTDNNRIARACGATIVNRTEELKEGDVGTGAGLFEISKFGDE